MKKQKLFENVGGNQFRLIKEENEDRLLPKYSGKLKILHDNPKDLNSVVYTPVNQEGKDVLIMIAVRYDARGDAGMKSEILESTFSMGGNEVSLKGPHMGTGGSNPRKSKIEHQAVFHFDIKEHMVEKISVWVSDTVYQGLNQNS